MIVLAIRKLTEKRRKVEGKLERRDITHDYSSFGSQTYAPLTRIGVFIDRGSELYNVKSKYLNSYQGVCHLKLKDIFDKGYSRIQHKGGTGSPICLPDHPCVYSLYIKTKDLPDPQNQPQPFNYTSA